VTLLLQISDMRTCDIQKDQVPVSCSDMSCVGRTFLYRTYAANNALSGWKDSTNFCAS